MNILQHYHCDKIRLKLNGKNNYFELYMKNQNYLQAHHLLALKNLLMDTSMHNLKLIEFLNFLLLKKKEFTLITN